MAVNTFGGEILFFLLTFFTIKFVHFFFFLYSTNEKVIDHDSYNMNIHHGSKIIEKMKQINHKEKIDQKKFKNNAQINIVENKEIHKEMKKNEIIFVVVWCTYRVCVLTMSCMCAFLHRRHLMVWAVFAPKVSTVL